MRSVTFHLQHGAQETGPHSIEALDEMIADGRAQPQDRVRPDNSDAWVTVEEFVSLRKYGPKDAAPPLSRPAPEAPPPLPQDFPAHNADRKVPLIGGQPIRGAEGMSVRDLTEMIRQGGRVTIFSYCISILVMTFRRPSSILLIRPGESGFGPALKYSLVSLLTGWWGFPWGPIYTIGSLVTNGGGGNDVTGPLLADLVGQAEAQKILASRTPPVRGGGFKAVGTGLLSMALIVFLAVFAIRKADERAESSVAPGPGTSRFLAANSTLRNGNAPGTGNTDAATAMAAHVSKFLGEAHGQFFKGGKGTPKFRTYCEQHGDGCAFLVFVPNIESYKDDESREMLAQLAWAGVQSAVRDQAGPAAQLGLGMRGFSGYDRVYLGHSAAAEESLSSTITSKQTGADSRDALVNLFAESE